jgi:glycerophosphoryl diester phosphodiesterase
MRGVRVAVLSCAPSLLYAYFAFVHPRHRVEGSPPFSSRRPLAIAHQGGGGLWPENTLLAFERSVELGVDALEMDLRGTADGHIVVHHDPSVDRTTDGTGLVASLTLEKLRALDAGYQFTEDGGASHPYRGRGLAIPTILEVMELFPESRLNVEMKEFSPALAGTLCSLLRENGFAPRVLVASIEHEPMAAFRRACPEVATSATMREGLLFYQLHRLRLGSLYRSPATAFQFPERFGDIHVIRPEILAAARSYNVQVHVWTVNEPQDMERMLALGVDGILTDYPDRLLRLMGRLARTP